MRSAQKNNRPRGRGGRRSSGGGNITNRVYDSAGPEGKVRGTPQQVIDKYLSLARDAQTSGDRVTAENFLQHAEHYQRLLIQAAAQQEQQRRDQAESSEEEITAEEEEAAPAPRRNQRRQAAERAQPEHEAEAETGEEIEGMTTIDASDESKDLLVEADEATPKPARRNGDARRRRPRQSADTQRSSETGEEETTSVAQQEG